MSTDSTKGTWTGGCSEITEIIVDPAKTQKHYWEMVNAKHSIVRKMYDQLK